MKPKFVQMQHPITKLWMKISTRTGRIVAHRKLKYPGIKIYTGIKPEVQSDLVQLQNPRTGRYIKIDRALGIIVSHKQTEGPYKGIEIVTGR